MIKDEKCDYCDKPADRRVTTISADESRNRRVEYRCKDCDAVVDAPPATTMPEKPEQPD